MWGNWLCKNIIILYMTRMSFYYLAYYMQKQFTKIMALKPPVPPVPPSSSDKDKEDYKEEFEPKPEYGKDFYMSFLIR